MEVFKEEVKLSNKSWFFLIIVVGVGKFVVDIVYNILEMFKYGYFGCFLRK